VTESEALGDKPETLADKQAIAEVCYRYAFALDTRRICLFDPATERLIA